MPDEDSSSRSTLRWIVLGTLLVFLVVGAGVIGVAYGRSTAAPQTVTEVVTRTVAETVEVTRQVTVVATAPAAQEGSALAAQNDSVEPGPTATAVPTSTPAPVPETITPRSIDFSTFYEVWDLISGEFDGELPSESDIVYDAIEGSLESLDDDFTRFVPPELAARLREDMSGSVSGIGAFVRENEEGLLEIVRPIDGQPADLAGLRANDIIIAVDGESVIELSFDEVLLKVRGPEGTTVELSILREGEDEPLEFSIVRTVFEVPTVEAEMLGTPDAPIAYVRLSTFNRNATEATTEALQRLLGLEPVGIIFDLRDNGGGFLDQSIAVADIFLPDGVVLYERNNRGLDETFTSDTGDLGEELPLVVLINAGSASASEIVAGAIQDTGRGTLVGETTFGKGSVQQVHQLSDGSELRVTIARWYTPNNQSISEDGITPDIEVPSPEDLGGEDDPQLQRAIDHLLEQINR